MFSQNTVRLLMSATIFGLSATAANALTLAEAIEKSTTEHPEVHISMQNREAIRQEWKGAVGGYMPTVNVQLGTGHEHSNNPTTRNRANRNDKEGHRALWRNEARLTVNQMLFDGFETDAETCQQRARYESATYEIQEVRENVALRTVEAYLNVMRAKDQLALQKENVSIHQKYLSQMKKRATSGKGAQADVRQAQGRLALAEANMLSAKGDYRKAQIDFNEITGVKPKGLKKYIKPLKGLPSNLENALERALENNPALKSAHSDIEAAEKAVKVAKAAFYPRLDLELEAARNHNLDGSEDANNEYSAMTRMRYNVYNGGSDTAKKNERKARLEEAKDALQRDTRLVEENVYTTWSELQTAKKRITPLASHVNSANQTRTAYKQQFDIGQRSLLDVLDSEVEYVNAKSAHINGKYAVDFAIFELLSHEGTLVGTLTGESTKVVADAKKTVATKAAK